MTQPSLPCDLSPRVLVELWSDLEQAYHGTHPFGSDTAEVYAYRLNTGRVFGTSAAIEGSADALVSVCLFFAEFRCASVTIDGLKPVHWMHAARQSFDHRCRVKVRPA